MEMPIEKQIVTNSVEKELPQHIRTLLWYILEQKPEHQEVHSFELDISKTENGEPAQKIVHTRKVPMVQKEHQYPDEAPIKSSIVIKVKGSGSQMMMLADELGLDDR